jgi:hypothetical protein
MTDARGASVDCFIEDVAEDVRDRSGGGVALPLPPDQFTSALGRGASTRPLLSST